MRPPIKVELPFMSRRVWVKVTPKSKVGDPKADIPRSATGSPGIYTIKFALSIPGKEVVQGNVNLSALANAGESLITLPDTREVKLRAAKDEKHINEARLFTDENGKLTHAVVEVNASDFDDAEEKAHNFLAPFLSWLSYQADVALDVKAYEIFEKATHVRVWSVYSIGDTRNLTWTPANELGIEAIKPDLRALHAAYREGMNAINPFYKFLCFYKIAEWCEKDRVRRVRRRRGDAQGASVPIAVAKTEQFPASTTASDIHPDDAELFNPYLGQDFSITKAGMEDVLRNAIAHLSPGRDVLNPDQYKDIAASVSGQIRKAYRATGRPFLLL